ncbi:class I SAM-dependent methyltransferase [Ancylomarina longa]|uniref:Class I SAM-dependent methyltransferase n=1 Tax=Ancylomarina longa TaxID=2487017 RepID=A0A434AXJ4_9BACT|nr:class I SAM-dependent methyltransferase [Ancylomarina longa]RUT79213.1 class I SAM-dependent methyltransferase [Ancylomarina longa]
MKEMWDKRYSESKFIYGTEPNRFFKEEINKHSVGKLLLPGEGEGRNAAYAAKTGWQVDAFDYSNQAVKNAQAFFQSQNVKVNMKQASILDPQEKPSNYDFVACLFLHLPSADRKMVHQYLMDSLSPGGIILLEMFSKKQLGRTSGGPQNTDMLYDLDEIKRDFEDFEILYLEENETHMNEGGLHQGVAMTIQFVGRKSKL